MYRPCKVTNHNPSLNGIGQRNGRETPEPFTQQYETYNADS